MEQKQLWTTIVVAVIAAIIASVITVSVMGGSASLSPKSLSATAPKTNTQLVSANDCKRDATCESRSINVEDSADISGRLTVNDIVFDATLFSQGEYDLTPPGQTSSRTVVIDDGSLAVSDRWSLSGSPIRLTRSSVGSNGIVVSEDTDLNTSQPDKSVALNSDFVHIAELQSGGDFRTVDLSAKDLSIQSFDGTRWYCGPNNNGTWYCSSYPLP